MKYPITKYLNLDQASKSKTTKKPQIYWGPIRNFKSLKQNSVYKKTRTKLVRSEDQWWNTIIM